MKVTVLPASWARLIAMSRSRRNRLIERWAGREWALRQQQHQVLESIRQARQNGDIEEAPLSMGQDAGLIHDIPSAKEVVERIAQEAEAILQQRLPALVQ
jgi:NAD(P)H-dependent flavin oxidoreductase YrpB (nitropropane dioxygenase family)